jgi:hypothetical protein
MASDGERIPIPEDLPLTGEARAIAAMVGLRDAYVEDEWAKYIGHAVQKGELSTLHGWYAGGWRKWCVDAKNFRNSAPKRGLARAAPVVPPPLGPPRERPTFTVEQALEEGRRQMREGII